MGGNSYNDFSPFFLSFDLFFLPVDLFFVPFDFFLFHLKGIFAKKKKKARRVQ